MLVYDLLCTELQWWSCSCAQQRLQALLKHLSTDLIWWRIQKLLPLTHWQRGYWLTLPRVAEEHPPGEGLGRRLWRVIPDCPNSICCWFDLSLYCWVKDAAALQGVFFWKFYLLLYCRVCAAMWKLSGTPSSRCFSLCTLVHAPCSSLGLGLLGINEGIFHIVAANRSRQWKSISKQDFLWLFTAFKLQLAL